MNVSAMRLLPILVIILCNLHGSYCIWSMFSDWVARNFPGTSYNGFTTAARVLGNITNHDVLERRDSNETELKPELGTITRTPKPEKYLSTTPTIGTPYDTSSFIAKNFTEATLATLPTFFDGFSEAPSTTVRSIFVDQSNGSLSDFLLPNLTILRTVLDVSRDLPTTPVSLTFEDRSKFTSTISSIEERLTTLSTPINGYEESKDIATTRVPLTYDDKSNDDSIRVSTGTPYNSEESSTIHSKSSDMESTTRVPSSYDVETVRTAIPITNDKNSELPSDVTTSSAIPILIELVNVSSLAVGTIGNNSSFLNFAENSSVTDITFLPDETQVFDENTTTSIYEDYGPSVMSEKRVDFVSQLVGESTNYDNGSDLYRKSQATLQTGSTITIFTPSNESYLHPTSTDKPSEAITKTISYKNELYTTISPRTTARLETEDPWLGYFDVVRSNDVKNCLSLMVCETSAEPELYQEYGKRISNFFQKYIPREDNRAGWWYKNAALMGMESKSVQSCKSNFPFCDIDTRHIFMLMEVPEY